MEGVYVVEGAHDGASSKADDLVDATRRAPSTCVVAFAAAVSPPRRMWNEGGGAKPPTKPLNQIVSDAVREQPPLEALPRTTAAWLENHAELSHLHLHLAEEDLASLCERLTSDRVGLLALFKAKGVTRLADRQKLANCLGRDRREGMFWLPGDPPPTRATQPTSKSAAAAQLSSQLQPPAPPSVQPSSSSSFRYPPIPARDAATPLSEDGVMLALAARQPVTALRTARALRDSSAAWLLRARSLVAMGSLAAAQRAYKKAHAQAVEDESNTSVDDVASLALAEKGRLHEIILAADALAASLRFFYPRTVPKEPSDQKLAGTYASDGIEIGYRIWKAPKRPAPGKGRAARGVLLYFHGNGELASDYHGIAELYVLMGLHLMVVEFRGYGWSTETPTRCCSLLSDAEPLVDDSALEAALMAAGIDHRGLPILLFGRSMGSSVAIHLAAHKPERFAGLVVESGFASMSARYDSYTDAEAEAVENVFPKPLGGVQKVGLMENEDKLKELHHTHTLILHGTADRIVPPKQAELAYAAAAGPKKLVLIDGAGHNDIAMSEEYFKAIAAFVDVGV